jgi:membrane associated rhomboid family serine protease
VSTEPTPVDPESDAPRSQAPGPPSIPKWTAFPDYPVISVTAVLAVAVTAASALDRDVSWLFDSPLVRRGQLWLLITSALPHSGFMHVVFNIYWLWIFGTTVERVFGQARTLGLILFLAYGSGAMEYAFFAGGVGLSGVGYGLFGFLWVLSRRDARLSGVLDVRTIRFFVGWFLACIVLTVLDVFPVANVAHGAGAFLGALAGFAVADAQRRRAFAAAIAAVLLFGTWAVTVGRPIVNLSSQGGVGECRLGYDAYEAKNFDQAAYWLRLSVSYRAVPGVCWSALGAIEDTLGKPERAIAAFRKGADGGDAYAQAALGGAYDDGTGVAKDQAQAILWYRKAADQGNALAQNNLAWIYVDSADPEIRNPVDALTYAQKAVASEHGAKNAGYLDTLAAAHFANGQCESALKTQEQALSLAEEEYREEFQKRLEKYQGASKTDACRRP